MKGILPCCNINLSVKISRAVYDADKRENGLLYNNACNKNSWEQSGLERGPLLLNQPAVSTFVLSFWRNNYNPSQTMQLQHTDMKLTFIKLWLTKETDGKSQVNNVVCFGFFFCLYSMFIKMFSLSTVQAFKSSFPTKGTDGKKTIFWEYEFIGGDFFCSFGIKEGLGSGPLRQGSLKCQTQWRGTRKTWFKLNNIIIDLLILSGVQLRGFTFILWSIGKFHTVSGSLQFQQCSNIQ